uniref:Uncharacterized protein n=1 Tax=Arundo donax TaxID=35708 RepID=A0A0A9CKI6_ARUDO
MNHWMKVYAAVYEALDGQPFDMVVDHHDKIIILCSNDKDAQLIADCTYACGNYAIPFYYVKDISYYTPSVDYVDWIPVRKL